MLKILNDNRDDLGPDMVIMMAAMLEMVYGADLLCNRMTNIIDHHIAGCVTMMHEKKRALNRCVTLCNDLLRNLDIAFDGTFDKIGMDDDGKFNTGRYEALRYLANDLCKVSLIYLSRAEVNDTARDSMKKALSNFKASPEYNMNDILSYFK